MMMIFALSPAFSPQACWIAFCNENSNFGMTQPLNVVRDSYLTISQEGPNCDHKYNINRAVI
jgi:hypothetical protein